MKKKVLLLASIVMTAAFVATACGTSAPTTPTTAPTTPAAKKILRTNNSSEPGSLDPALAQGTHESWVLDHTFEGLMKRSKEGLIVEGVAEKYTLADDQVTYTFTLRDDAKWSNGEKVTAQDFEFAWKRVLDPALAADYSYQMFYLKNGAKYNSGEAKVEDVGVKAIDEKTLEVVLEVPTAYFLELTAFYTYYPVNKKLVESNADWAKDPKTYVSNGPFKLTDWVHNASIKLEKTDTYYDAANVKLDGIEFAILEDATTAWQKYEGGEFDFLTPIPGPVVGQLKASNSSELVIGTDLATYYYNFNSKRAPFDNAKVRRGLSMAIDRKTIVEKITMGGQTPAEGVVPFGMFDENNTEYRTAVGNLIKYDLTEAKKVFEEGLAEAGMTLAQFNAKGFKLLYNTSETHKKIAEAVQNMWKTSLGVEIGLENVEFQVKLDREKAGDYDISRAGWIGDYADPMTFIDLWETTSSYNDAKFSNAEYDKLVAESKATVDQKVRMENMRKAEKLLMEQMPIAPVYFYTQPYVQKSYVSGIYKPINRYPYFIYADINK
ncbi:peptide ABC transporter substrate-binding protein [Youngiibacter fragilis]|uniref:Peptide-binding protein n=1 Tax=Youngiibacter fragilis 232.1 TaxID=994573 RepID=V7I125_9CLOT|nr:peptide ABC transporter substrate-binding protein [Youngiibacter fragilis]ETA79563.1 peptide-binding protein [Youngiibacter fragilis 232.1]